MKAEMIARFLEALGRVSAQAGALVLIILLAKRLLTGTRKALFYNDRSGLLFARATLTDLNVMDQAIQVLNVAPPQVALEVTFVELGTSEANMLGLDGSMLNTNSPITPVTGILSEPQFQKLLRTLEAREGVDVLTAPKVSTLGGRQARIELTELKSVVSGAVDKTRNTYVTTKVPTGPSIDITPDVWSDGRTIDLTILANLTEFLGYDNPGFLSPSIANEPARPLPRFRSRKAMSTATIQDGQTLMLGGFVSQDLSSMNNKVAILGAIPLLGRLFRSESASRTNKQLVMFVTPTIIDPAGNRIHPPADNSPAANSAPSNQR